MLGHLASISTPGSGSKEISGGAASGRPAEVIPPAVGASGGLLEGLTHLLDEAGDVGQLGPSVAGLLVEGLVE